MTGDRRAVWMVDPVGGHRGMHYYDFALCEALRAAGVDVSLWTCDETQACSSPQGLPIHFPFRRIFGGDSAAARGLRYGRALRQILAESDHICPALVHLHYFLLGPVDLWFLRELRHRGIKSVLTVHDVIPFNARLHTRTLFRALYDRVNGFVVHTEHSRRELLATFPIDPARVRVIPHGHYLPFTGTDLPDQRAARAELDLPEGIPVMLFFGQIKEVKGLDVLLRALPAVIAAHPDAMLLVAGQVWKDDWARYAALIRDLHIGEHVLARIEHIPERDVTRLYCAADVVVLPYRRIYQSGVLLMAYSYERAVVASAVGGLAETVEDGVTGWLVQPDDPLALAGALNAVLDDRGHALEMGVAARRMIETKFGWTRIAARTHEFYQEILQS